jgi:hypothetical protein
MNHNHNSLNAHKAYKFSDFLPLIIIIGLIIGFTLIRQFIAGWNFNNAMLDFMAGFFIIFSLFKIFNLKNFVEAYSGYDIIAKRSQWYGYLYPFLELSLGIAYLFRFQLFFANIITIILMFISSIGVLQALLKKNQIMCACLGAVFKIPMTYVTLAEDLIMGLMALYMLVR